MAYYLGFTQEIATVLCTSNRLIPQLDPIPKPEKPSSYVLSSSDAKSSLSTEAQS